MHLFFLRLSCSSCLFLLLYHGITAISPPSKSLMLRIHVQAALINTILVLNFTEAANTGKFIIVVNETLETLLEIRTVVLAAEFLIVLSAAVGI